MCNPPTVGRKIPLFASFQSRERIPAMLRSGGCR